VRHVEPQQVTIELDGSGQVGHGQSDVVRGQRKAHRPYSSTSRTTDAMRAWSGRTKSSSGGLKGTGTAGMVTRRAGARSAWQVGQSSIALATISDAMEHVGADSSTTTSLPVRW